MSSMSVGTTHVRFSCAQAQIKGEDVLVVPKHDVSISRVGKCVIFGICDGHGSSCASLFIGRSLGTIVDQNIDYCALELAKDMEEVASVFRRCVQAAFNQLDVEFSQKYDSLAGSTLSIVIVYGRLVTIGNVGDSKAIIWSPDIGVEELTDDHRIHDNVQERERMVKQGALIAKAKMPNRCSGGVLRVWPAGLALSRAIGDEESKPFVVSSPYISQVILPDNYKAKVIMASDGLWDELSVREVAKVVRNKKLAPLPQSLIKKTLKKCGGYFVDDTSVVAICLKTTPYTRKNKPIKDVFNFMFSQNKEEDSTMISQESGSSWQTPSADIPQGFNVIGLDSPTPVHVFRTDTVTHNTPSPTPKRIEINYSLSSQGSILSQELAFSCRIHPTRLLNKFRF